MKLSNFLYNFPGLECCICANYLVDSSSRLLGICHSCANSLHPISEPFCSKCGISLLSEQGDCLDCRPYEGPFPHLKMLRSCYHYWGSAADFLLAYKKHSWIKLANFFARALEKSLSEFWTSEMVLTTAPSTFLSRHMRGFDHTKALVTAMKPHYRRSFQRLLVRKPGASQKSLGRDQRSSNLIGKIAYAGPKRTSNCVTIIDDVCTSGATLSCCAAVLKEAGFEKVYALTLFRD